jgi:predicted nucleic acid-binding protein
VVQDEAVPPEILAWDLGAGETQVITNARRHGADRVVLDDLEARRGAKAMELKVIGTLGIVARAKRAGRIQL